MRKLADLTKEQLEHLEIMPHYAWMEEVGNLMGWTADGFGDFTIDELTDVLLEYVEKERKKKEGSKRDL